MLKQFCKNCGKKCEGEYCFIHKKRKSFSQKFTNKKLILEEVNIMRDFFLSVWKKRLHKSEVSGDNLGREPLTVFFHHILPKEKYSMSELDEENIILLTTDEHANVENDMYCYEEVNNKRKHLIEKYKL